MLGRELARQDIDEALAADVSNQLQQFVSKPNPRPWRRSGG